MMAGVCQRHTCARHVACDLAQVREPDEGGDGVHTRRLELANALVQLERPTNVAGALDVLRSTCKKAGEWRALAAQSDAVVQPGYWRARAKYD